MRSMKFGASVRRRATLALVVMVLPILLIGTLGILAIDSSSERFQDASEEQLREASTLIQLRDDLITAEYWAMQYVNQGQRKAQDEYLELVPRIDTNVELLQRMDDPGEADLASQIADAWAIAGPVGDAAMELPPGSSETEAVYPLEEFHPAMEEAIGLLVDLNEHSLQEMSADIGQIQEYKDGLVRGLGLVLLLSVLFAGLMSRNLRKLIHIPLTRLEDAARRFGDHDFEHRVEIPRNDEFGKVGSAFNAMAERVSISQRASENLQVQLQHQALHDPLTGLANRTLLSDRVEHAIKHLSRVKGRVGVLFLDVDNFKTVNDTFGHDTGDEILISIGERLQRCVRADDTVARFGGDEFAVLLGDIGDDEDPQAIVERILEAMTFMFVVGSTEITVHTSIGVALTSDPETLGPEIIRRADVAMYAAKSQGKNTWFLYTEEMDGDRLGDAHLKSELNHAIELGELEALFQPLVELPSERVVGLEALVRWNHPTQGQLSPEVFLPIAEETGFVYDIDCWMLKEACTQAVAWREDGADPFSISVNLSGVTLHTDDIVDDVARILGETGITPSDVILEITENVFVHNDAVWRLTELKKLGVRLAIDDFGTGYSSLNYLKRFPIDILKIDKSFIDGNNRQPGVDLTKAIVMLAEALRLDTVAEGIETQDQLRPLSILGVGLGQGFLFARPLEQKRVGAILEHEQSQTSDESPLEPSSGA